MTPENMLIDAFELLISAQGEVERWDAIECAAETIGANSVIVSQYIGDEKFPLWARGNMSASWLDEYMASAFFEIDPLLEVRASGHVPTPTNVFDQFKKAEKGSLIQEMTGSLLSHEYKHFSSYTSHANEGTGSRMVVFSSDDSVEAFHGRSTSRVIPLIAELIAMFATAPEEVSDPGAFFLDFHGLSVRERDTLRYLASGFRNDAIAAKMGVEEVTVRFHINNAKRKLKSKTREQALVRAFALGLLKP